MELSIYGVIVVLLSYFAGFVLFVSHGKVWSLFGFMGLYFFMGW